MSNIWVKIKDCIVDKDNILEWGITNIIYNLVHPKPQHVINVMVLIAKYVIFRCKCQNEQPNFNKVYYEMKLFKDIEESIAYKNNKIKLKKLKNIK